MQSSLLFMGFHQKNQGRKLNYERKNSRRETYVKMDVPIFYVQCKANRYYDFLYFWFNYFDKNVKKISTISQVCNFYDVFKTEGRKFEDFYSFSCVVKMGKNSSKVHLFYFEENFLGRKLGENQWVWMDI